MASPLVEKVKRLLKGRKLEFEVNGKKVTIKKTIFPLVASHKIYVGNKLSFHVNVSKEGDKLRISLLNHKNMQLNLLPGILERFGEINGANRVLVELSGLELNQLAEHFEKAGYNLKTRARLPEAELVSLPIIGQYATKPLSVYEKEIGSIIPKNERTSRSRKPRRAR